MTEELPECVGQQFGHVARTDWRQMVDLMAAAGARSDDHGSERLIADRLRQRLGHFEGEFVFGLQSSERSGHPAAAGIQQGDSALWQALREAAHKGDIHDRFCVAMRVDDNIGGLGVEFERARFMAEQVLDELFE